MTAGGSGLRAFVAPVAKLASGTAASQALGLAASALMARLFAPEAVGAFATVVAVSSVLSLIVTGRFEVAIPTVRMSHIASSLEILALRLNRIAWLVLCAVALAYLAVYMTFGFKDPIGPWVWLAGTAVVFTAGTNQILLGQANRHGRFGDMARSRMILSVCNVALIALVGALAPRPALLVLSLACAQTCANLYLANRLSQVRKCPPLDRRTSLALARRHRNFPLYVLPSDALNALAAAAPIFLMGFFFGTAETGAFALVQRALLGPLTIVSGAVQEVFKSHLLETWRAGGSIRRLFAGTGLVLGVGGVVLFLGGLFVAPPLLLLIFGARWQQAALFATAMAIYYAAKFVVSPLSYVITFFRKLRFDFWMHIFFLAGSVVAFCAGALHSAFWAVRAYSLFMAFIYGVYLIFSYRLVQREAAH